MATADELLTQVNALIPRIDTMLGKRELREAETVDWWAGTPTGGPQGDGRYPLTANDGTVRLVPSPSAIAALAGSGGAGGGGLDAGGVAALLDAVAADGAAGFRFLGVAADGQPKRFAPAVVPSPLPDLPRVSEAFATDLVEVSRNGSRRGLPLSALTQLTTGKINVKEAPYNCKGDYREVRDGQVALYGTILKSASNPWTAADVGKQIYIGNRSAGLATNPRTIVGCNSAGEIVLNAQTSIGGANLVVGWGTDDTAGLRAAMAAAAPRYAGGFGGVVELPPGRYLTDYLYLPTRTAIFGYGTEQSVLVRRPVAANVAGATNDTLSNQYGADDFPVIVGIGIYGLKTLQAAQQRGYRYHGDAGFGSYEFTDPFPRINDLDIFETSGDALVHAGQGNGIWANINIRYPAGFGFKSSGYDMLISGLYIIGGSDGAVWMDAGSAGNNINNGKFSFSGGFPRFPQNADYGHLVWLGAQSGGMTFVGCRAQESYLSAWVVGGHGHKLIGCSAESMGNVGCFQGSSANAPPVDRPRAGVLMLAGGYDHSVDMHIAVGVDPDKINATHALFVADTSGSNPAAYNDVLIRTQRDLRPGFKYGAFSQGGTARTGRAYPKTTGAYAPGMVGTDSPNGISPTNDISVNGSAI
ncbi:hypothetical protein [Sphingomonas adhaesiva]|uniref:hypothetical protein n=1 Tax=Sphingomonas adhaesiva TaxID=28212 RepID=UPI002FF9362E